MLLKRQKALVKSKRYRIENYVFVVDIKITKISRVKRCLFGDSLNFALKFSVKGYLFNVYRISLWHLIINLQFMNQSMFLELFIYIIK